jgi:DNA-binding transcriptional MerR regulator
MAMTVRCREVSVVDWLLIGAGLMDDSYTIGTVARLAEVGTETIRFYERKGLVESPPRNGSGYRVYNADIVERIRFIRDARALGFSLAQVQVLLQGQDKEAGTCRTIKQLLLDKAREIEEQQRKIAVARDVLEKLIDDCPSDAGCSICRVALPIGEPPNP